MHNIINYTHLVTKIRAMQGKMLSNEDFDNLLALNSVQDVANYLKHHTYYKESFAGISDDDVHRGDLEVLLYRAMITDALKIARYLKGKEKILYRFVYRKQEIEDLKKMIRALQAGIPLKDLNRRIMFVSRYSRIDFNLAQEATNIRELVDTLKGTNYFEVLDPLIEKGNAINTFAAEMALDLYYYKRFDEQIKKLMRGKNADILKMSVGLDVDFRNMMWLYRGKKFYNIRKEILFAYMLPGGYKLKREQLIELAEVPTAEQLLERLKKGPYREIVDFDSGHWDNSFFKYYGRMQGKNVRLLPNTIAPIIGYIFLKEIEILNLTTIIEGIRYNVERSKLESFLSR